jgi:hypothetical protein
MALFEEIGKPSNPTATNGPASILLTGGTMLLDGTKMRHVTIQKVEVYYNVGPGELEDVVFVDCEFVLSINDQARAFARAILIEGQVNWNSESPTQF